MAGSLSAGVPDYVDPQQQVRRLLSSHNSRDRKQGELMLRDLQAREQHQQQLHEFQQREADRQQTHLDNMELRRTGQEQQNTAREGIAADREKAGEDRRALMLTHLLSDPGTDPTVRSAIQDHLLRQSGVSATLPVDPKVAALARSKGLPEPTGKTVGGAPQPTAPAQTGAPGGFQRNVDAGHVAGPLAAQIPAGKDLNFNTGELVDSNMEGTINGRPARTAVAEGALKMGVSPEDTKSRELYNTMRSNPSLAANQPAPNENMTPSPVTPWHPSQLVGANELATPPSTLGEPKLAANPVPGAQPNPAPTPGGTPEPSMFSGLASNITTPPQPPPSTTPPAIPPTQRPTQEEERRRLLANQ